MSLEIDMGNLRQYIERDIEYLRSQGGYKPEDSNLAFDFPNETDSLIVIDKELNHNKCVANRWTAIEPWLQ